MIAYKLLRLLKDGSITPLFINKGKKLPIGKWMDAEPHPTKGYKFRPYWHCTSEPIAPHLSLKNRKWYVVEIENFTIFKRSKFQGGVWYLAEKMKILKEYQE